MDSATSDSSSEACLAEPLEEFGLRDSVLETELASFKNDQGFVRLDLIKGNLNLNLLEDREILAELYSQWVLDDMGIVIEEKHSIWQARHNWASTTSYKWMKCRKRGNDVDGFRISRRMRGIRDAIMPYCQSENPLKETRALYVTLTVDPRMTGKDLESAWRHVGRWFNDFKSRLSHEFATIEASAPNGEFVCKERLCKIQAVRSWESHGRKHAREPPSEHEGWPHVHAILCFEDFNFGIFQDQKFRWRAKYKEKFEDAWPHGFVDVVALTPGTLERELENVLWYVSKSLASMDYRLVRSWPQKRLLTQSILWYLGARAFSISRSLAAADLITRTSIIQNDLEGKGFKIKVVTFKFVGLVRRKDTELHRDDWAKVYSEPPDWLDRCWVPRHSHSGLGWTNSWGT